MKQETTIWEDINNWLKKKKRKPVISDRTDTKNIKDDKEIIMTKDQNFIFEQIKYGLAKKSPPELMNDEDIERLGWDADDYTRIPMEEWLGWSRKIHWALQVAFMHNTDRFKNLDKINKWKRHCFNIVSDTLIKKERRSPKVIDSAVLHFMDYDLIPITINEFGHNALLSGLSKEERIVVEYRLRAMT